MIKLFSEFAPDCAVIVIPKTKKDVDTMVTVFNRACNTWHPNPPPEILKILDELKKIQLTLEPPVKICSDCGYSHTSLHCRQ